MIGVEYRFLEGIYKRKYYFYLRSLEVSMRFSVEYFFDIEKENKFISMIFKFFL